LLFLERNQAVKLNEDLLRIADLRYGIPSQKDPEVFRPDYRDPGEGAIEAPLFSKRWTGFIYLLQLTIAAEEPK
jgi:hypothetical protein